MKKITLLFIFAMGTSLIPFQALASKTVEQYREWPQEAQKTYMMGLVDTFNYWILIPPPVQKKDTEEALPKNPAFPNYDKCILELTYAQIRGIVEAYMEGHPEKRDSPVSSLYLLAMEEECRKKGFDTKEYLW